MCDTLLCLKKYTSFDKNIIKKEGSYKEDVYKTCNNFEGQFLRFNSEFLVDFSWKNVLFFSTD